MDAAVPGSSLRVDALAAAALVLARRFSAGCTMWCLAPAAPEHARHVAVEFVHPVIVGKRALPAVSVDGPDPVAALRSVARPGDVVLAVGPSDDDWWSTAPAGARMGPHQHRVGRGDEAARQRWSPTPASGPTGDRQAGDATTAASSCLPPAVGAHPRVLRASRALLVDEPACADDVCVTCSDEGRLAEVVADRRPLRCDGAHGTRRRAGGRVPGRGARPGDLVLVHAGTAISVVDGRVTVTDFLYPFIEGGERDPDGPARPIWPPPRRPRRRQSACAPASPRWPRGTGRAVRRGRRHGRPLRSRRPAVRVRQRRQLDRRRRPRRAVRPTRRPGGGSRRGPWPTTTPC